MKMTTVGIDLAKQVFPVHGVNPHGKTVLKKQLRRNKVLAFFANLPPCLIGLEACGSAHHWARQLETFGHEVKLMAPQFVTPYVKTNKTDAAEAEAICEAVGRENMRFVAIKTTEQQAILAVHRARQGFVKARTAQANQIRGLLAEFGIIIPQGISHIGKQLPVILDDEDNAVPGTFRAMLARLGEHLNELDQHVQDLATQIEHWHRSNEASRRLAQVPGIGPLTASALIATIGDAKQFTNGRQLAAWLGLVPRQHSTGGKPLMLGISNRGDSYLRALLVHGARAVLRVAEHKRGATPVWLQQLIGRRHKNVAAVALANKHVRIVWALLAHERDYQADYASMAVSP